MRGGAFERFVGPLPKNSRRTQSLAAAFPSALEYVPVVEALTHRLARALSFDEIGANEIAAAAVEGAMNALQHGNRGDISKSIYYAAIVEPHRLTIKIRDEGDGFRAEEVADPREGDGVWKDCGRGLLLMRYYMDSVSYAKGGTELTMVKKRADAGGADDDADKE